MKKQITFISAFLVLLVFFFKLELSENYDDIVVPRKHEQKLKPVKNSLPSHSLEKLIQFFFLTTRTIQGKARIVKPTIQTIQGVARIAPYQPRVLTAIEQQQHPKQKKILEEFFKS